MKTAAILLLALGLASCGAPDLQPDLAAAERVFPRKADEVWAATIGAAKDFDLTIDSREHDSQGGRADARRADGGRIKLGVRSVEADKTSVSIRGDANLAELILDRVSARLGTRPAAPRPPATPTP